MAEQSINGRVMVAGLVIAATTLITGGAGVWTAFHLGDAQRRTEADAKILQNHMTADMMHDALRGDVLATMLAARTGRAADIEMIKQDLADHASTFETAIAENKTLASHGDVAAVIAAVETPFVDYVAAASQLVNTAAVDVDLATQAMPDFMERFGSLEDAMAAAAEKIEAATAKDAEEARAAAFMAKIVMGLSLIVGLIVTGGMILMARRSIVGPLVRLTGAMESLAQGNLEVEPPHADRKDEIGALAHTMTLFRENAIARQKLEAAQGAEAAARLERAERVDRLVRSFSDELSQSLAHLDQASQQMGEEAEALKTIAANAQTRSTSAAGAATTASENVENIASATTELSASIAEIAQRVEESASMARLASAEGQTANQTVTELADAVHKIGEIVSLISAITAQTNLLALNATIEAARAGDAGKGFAVVASEVKTLATQTEKATADITERVAMITSVSEGALAQVRRICEAVAQIEGLSGAVAAAASEQSAATNSIAASVETVALGASGAAEGVRELQGATGATGEASDRVLNQADTVQSQARALREAADAFFAALKAA